MTASSSPTAQRPLWRRLVGFNLLTAILLGIGGWYLGYFLGHHITGPSISYFGDTDQNDISVFLGYIVGVIGFLIGLGFLQYPLARLRGYPPSLREKESEGVGRYFGLCTDHKVVGIQYLIGIGLFFFIAGLNAMLIRFELLRPTPVFNSGNYLTLVGLHGTMMMGMMTSGILGPFANYFVPIMIGARRMAFPRIESLTFWLLMAAGGVLMTTIFFGGFPTGWTGYEPLNDQANRGMDSYIVFFVLVGISMCLLGLNMIATVVTMRAPGMTWGRLPIFVWARLHPILNLLAAPFSSALRCRFDRTAQTTSTYPAEAAALSRTSSGSSATRGYILASRLGILLELPLFARKPLWGAGAVPDARRHAASFLVWQHHLFVSGINSNLRPFYMLSTELISIPTGFTFLCGLMTLWRGSIRYTVPMLFSLAWFFNFLIGGLSGLFNSDTPSDTTEHGSFFVMAHFHYTIMGGLIFAFFAGLYYWLPKMLGYEMNKTLGKIHFWTMFIFFNSTFLPLFALGMMGMPRRVFEYARNLQTLNDWASISSFLLGGSILIFLINFIWSTGFARVKAAANPWNARGLEWQVSSPPPPQNFAHIPVVLSGPYEYGVKDAPPVADLNPPVGVVSAAYAGAGTEA
jgi:cytochrome c oxidase subunit 1